MWIVHEPKENLFPGKNTDSKDRLCLPKNSSGMPDLRLIHGGRSVRVLEAKSDREKIANNSFLMTTHQVDLGKEVRQKLRRLLRWQSKTNSDEQSDKGRRQLHKA